jgi:small conductance mechanosensitive channel
MERIQQMLAGMVANLPNFAIAIVVFGLLLVAARIVRRIVKRISGRAFKNHPMAAELLARLSQIVLVIFSVLIALSIILPDFGPGRIIEFLGVTSVAVGFAFRDILQNFLAGILILLGGPFRLDETISVRGVEGRVKDIKTRDTVIELDDGRRVHIPNSMVFTDMVTIGRKLPDDKPT